MREFPILRKRVPPGPREPQRLRWSENLIVLDDAADLAVSELEGLRPEG
jgi:hypothetical protein